MKANNQEKSPYAGFSLDPVKPSGEKPAKEQFTGKIVSDGDLRTKEAYEKCSVKNI